jgi:hypothetical protein
MINFYCLTTSDFEDQSAFDILKKRLNNKRYPLYKKTPFLDKIKKNDNVLFYVAGKNHKAQNFIGTAIIEDLEISEQVLTDAEKNKAIAKLLVLNNIKVFENSVPIRPIISQLEFIINKYNFGLSLIGGVSKITENDFNLIIN